MCRRKLVTVKFFIRPPVPAKSEKSDQLNSSNFGTHSKSGGRCDLVAWVQKFQLWPHGSKIQQKFKTKSRQVKISQSLSTKAAYLGGRKKISPKSSFDSTFIIKISRSEQYLLLAFCQKIKLCQNLKSSTNRFLPIWLVHGAEKKNFTESNFRRQFCYTNFSF